MAKIIVIEGGDKQGKHTQACLLLEKLKTQGYSAYLVEVPVEDLFTYKLIYKMLKNGWALKLPTMFQFIQFLNRLFFQINVLPKLERSHDYIIFDRWALSGKIYGDATGVPSWFSKALYNTLVKPDITLILNGQQKTNKVEDTFEEKTSLQTLVRDAYNAELVLAVDAEDLLRGVNSDGAKEIVSNRVYATLAQEGIV